MNQVLMNLYINAWQAMLGGGDLFLETRNAFMENASFMGHKVPPGEYDDFLSLPELDQKAYVLFQRSDHFGLHPREMLSETELVRQLHHKIKAVESEVPGGFNRYVRNMMAG